VKRDLVGLGGRLEVGSHVVAGHRDAAAMSVGRGEGLGHGGRECSAFGAMSALELRHQPGEIAHGQYFNLRRKGGELLTESSLEFLGERSDGCRKLPGDGRLSQGGAEAEQPQAGRGDTAVPQTAQVHCTVADENVTEEMIVDDDASHLGGGEIGIVHSPDEPEVLFGGESVPEEPLPRAGREEDDCFAKIEDRHASTLIQTPSMPYRSWHRHLSAR
jgi:hypothetical protein